MKRYATGPPRPRGDKRRAVEVRRLGAADSGPDSGPDPGPDSGPDSGSGAGGLEVAETARARRYDSSFPAIGYCSSSFSLLIGHFWLGKFGCNRAYLSLLRIPSSVFLRVSWALKLALRARSGRQRSGFSRVLASSCLG